MLRFEVLCGDLVIGYSDLELGDPPMGCASGKFVPAPSYSQFQQPIAAALETSQTHLSLKVRPVGEAALDAQGGVRIYDSLGLFAGEPPEVHVMGVGYPRYEELFPGRYAAYEASFEQR